LLALLLLLLMLLLLVPPVTNAKAVSGDRDFDFDLLTLPAAMVLPRRSRPTGGMVVVQ
jgi:hypothetical protein